MTAAQQGDGQAYRALLDDIGPWVMSFLRSRVVDHQEVDDLYQETLLALHRARHTYQPPRPVDPWLFAIAGHVLSRYMRRRRLRSARELLVETLPQTAVEDAGHGAPQLAEALLRLPPNQRQAIELLKLEGLSVVAAAARAGTTAGALKVRAHRAYKALKELLRR
ncbi:MAG TPA: sigma-70 family RNA polymerase sigma factor [Candidatus Binatia bacterium]|nr:sigma-70 family RNA polymerase sigma factor [Candidatus Binatia bacterium]